MKHHVLKISFLVVQLIICAIFSLAAVHVMPEQPVNWQPVTLTFDGPSTSEDAAVNPFLDYRMSVEFRHRESATTRTVQGFFAADGDAGNSSAKEGNKWRVRFTPPQAGQWDWKVSFRTGSNVALGVAGGVATAFDSDAGKLDVGVAPDAAIGFQKKGFLTPGEGHYLQFSNGDYFLKGGADSPENFLG